MKTKNITVDTLTVALADMESVESIESLRIQCRGYRFIYVILPLETKDTEMEKDMLYALQGNMNIGGERVAKIVYEQAG